MERNQEDVKRVKYLIRRLAIIGNDGQSHEFGLRYLEADKDGIYLNNLAITKFEREEAGVIFIDRLTMMEESCGIFKIVPD